MKINLITSEQHAKMLGIYQNTPSLFLQNTGYEGINKDKLNPEDKEKLKYIDKLLEDHIHGFSYFQNFRLNKKTQQVELRFQYNYSHESERSFIGVGYMLLDELLNGFDVKD